MLEKFGNDKWKDKVRIMGISIDKDVETVNKHVEKNKWTSVEHFHRAGSTCSKDYGINGVPHIMLIDKNGMIVFKGHPASRKIEEDIDKLIAGESLSGKGTAPIAASGDKDSKEEED